MQKNYSAADAASAMLYVAGCGYVNAKSAAKLGLHGEEAYQLPEPEVLTTRPARVAAEPEIAWFGARYAPANDNRADRRWKGEENYGPDADRKQREENPGTSRDYHGDVFSRLVASGEHEAAFVLRQVGALLSPAGMTAANDNFADDADVETGDGFGLDYAMEEPKAETIIQDYAEDGRLSGGHLKFRQRCGNPGGKVAAGHRRLEKEGLHVDRYLALRGVARLPAQEHASDGETPWWRSHAPKNADTSRELAAACERTDWRKVTWIRYAPMGARVYGDLSIYSKAKGVGEGKTSAPEHNVPREIIRGEAEKAFRERMPARSIRIIEAALERGTYTEIADAEGMSRNGAKKAIKSALKEAWAALVDITGEKMPEAKKLAA